VKKNHCLITTQWLPQMLKVGNLMLVKLNKLLSNC